MRTRWILLVEFQLRCGGGEGRRRSSRRAGRRRRKHHHKPFQGADQGAAQPSFVDVAGRGGTNAPRLGAIQDRCDPFRVPRESLQSKIMASTGVPAVEAKALLQAQCETVTAKSSSSSSAPPGQSRVFRMHYDSFDTQLASMVMTVDDVMLRSLQDDPTVKRMGKDVKRYPMVWKETAAGQLATNGQHGSRNLKEE